MECSDPIKIKFSKPGEHQAIIRKAEERKEEWDNEETLYLELEILEGEHKGRKLFGRCLPLL